MKNKYLVLVNKSNKLEDESAYEKVDSKTPYADGRLIEKETFNAFLKFQNFIKENGYDIEIISAYRSIEYQQKVWDKCVLSKGLEHTKKYVAVPGYSEHHTGLALDFGVYEDNKFLIEHDLKGHPVLKLVADNAYKFGFIIRYPEGKEDITGYGYEPWHLRYIQDIDVAKYIKDNNLCLEEYLER